MTVPVEDLVHQQLLADPSGSAPGAGRIATLVRRADPLLSAPAVDAVVGRVMARVVGLGLLEPLLAAPDVSDILVNGPGMVWVERAGSIEPTEIMLDRAEIDLLIERILAPLGRRVDPVSPMADGRLPDGSRVHVVVPPLAIDGPCLTIRRFATRSIRLGDVAPEPVAELLRAAVKDRANLLVVGATGSGKTTLLNALAATIPRRERVITIEDAAELHLPSDHVIRLETRPASVEGVPAVTARELVRNALRMRPDRLIVGEVRAGEALDMIQAMNTGHDGSLSTIHANGCDDALRRLETLVLLAGVGLPLSAVRDHIGAAVDVIVHIARGDDGLRRVLRVAEVVEAGAEGGGSWRTRVLADDTGIVAEPCRPWSDGTARDRHPEELPS